MSRAFKGRDRQTPRERERGTGTGKEILGEHRKSRNSVSKKKRKR
jgi:hypothetical protein